MIRHANRSFGQLAFVCLALFLAVAFAFFNKGDKFQGIVRVIDGDSLRLETHEIRLYGIDAPEFSQTCDEGSKKINCGREAARYLSRLIDGKAVACVKQDTDRYGRSVSICKVGDLDLGRQMVLDGHAVSYGSYLKEQAEAKQHNKGIWATSFERPSDYRKRRAEERGN